MKYIAALLGAVNAVSIQDGYEPSFEHTHVEYGTEERFRDVEVLYDEIQYSIETKTESEIRTRQIPVQTTCEHVETKYQPEEELRYTKAYEIKYRPNVYTRFTWEPRLTYGFYTETKWRDIPFTSYETHYEILYREEEEHRYRNEIEILERPDSITQYRDEPETRYTNEYTVLYREETETRYNTVFDENVRIEHRTEYRTEEETRVNTIYEIEYQPKITTQTREVPVITYETAFRDEETITYNVEYETRTRDVPVEREIVGEHSNDSGDGVESEPELIVSAQELADRQAASGEVLVLDGGLQGGLLRGDDLLLGDSLGHGAGRGLGLGLGGLAGKWAQTAAPYGTADSSDDTHVYTVTEYVTEEYQVAKKVPVVTIEQVPYQVAKTEYVTEEY